MEGLPRRILVRSVNWLGDAVMTMPALQRLRERFPDAHIALLTAEKLRDLWRHHPAINEVIPFAADAGLLSVGRELRAKHFDLAVVLPNSPRSAMEMWLARIPQRIGYARPWRNWLLTCAVPTRPGHKRMHKRTLGEIKELVAADGSRRSASPGSNTVEPGGTADSPPSAHQIHEYLYLTAALGGSPEPMAPQMMVTLDEVESARKKFGLMGKTHSILGLNPGAEYGPAKRWPAERFAAAAREIQRRTNCVWLILGGKGDRAVTDEINSALGESHSAVLNLAGQTSLRELCTLLKLCRVLLTNDTGPMHVAAALGTPVVVPFGSTSPELTAPVLAGDTPHRLLQSNAPCSPCFRRVCPIDFRCMTGISVERVVEAVVGTLNR